MKILLVKLGHLGDTLLLTPTLRWLRENHSEARIDVFVRRGCEIILEGNPDITHLLAVARPEKEQRSPGESWMDFKRAFTIVFAQRYDLAFDLSDSDRAKFWIAVSRARIRAINDAYHNLGWRARLFNRFSRFDWAEQHQVLRDFRTVAEVLQPEAQPGPIRFHPQADAAATRAKLPFIPASGDYAIIHPTSRWAFKQWLPARWAAVADAIRQRHGLTMILSIGPAERERDYARTILAASRERHFSTDGKTTLHELGWLLQRARLFLGVDTVAMHLAAAMQTPTVALFGPSAEWAWRPWQCPHELALGECPCKQTRQFVCDKSKPYPCLERITVEEVLAKTARVLAASNRRALPLPE